MQEKNLLNPEVNVIHVFQQNIFTRWVRRFIEVFVGKEVQCKLFLLFMLHENMLLFINYIKQLKKTAKPIKNS